jgi:trimethylamine--corrinoid protein Co-methyltransferase
MIMIQSSFLSQKSPNFSVLSQDQVFEIHRASLEVLEKTGYKILSKNAINLLKKAGARVEGEIVKTPQHIVEEGLSCTTVRGTGRWNSKGERVILGLPRPAQTHETL